MDKTKKTKPTTVDLLFAADDELVISTIALMAEKGNKDVINPLLELLLNCSPAVKKSIENLLFQLKNQEAIDLLIDALENPKFESVRPTILASFWNSGHLPEGHIDLLCKIAANGTFDEVLEVLTIVENMDGPLEPIKLQNSILMVSSSIHTSPENSRTGLLENLMEELIKFQQS